MNLDGSWDYIIGIARSRLTNNKTTHHIAQYGEGIELLGVAGEILARRFLGLSEEIHVNFDQGVDFYYKGRSVDVKTTLLTPKVQHRFLQWPEWKRVKSEIIIMAAVDPIQKIGTVIGFATRGEILSATVNRSRDIACYEIPVPELHPAWELVSSNLPILSRPMDFQKSFSHI